MNENNLISTSELANKLNTTKDVILAVVKKCLPNKEIKHGKATYFNEMETTIIIDHMKNNVSNNRSVEFNSTVSIATTSKDNQLKMYKLNEESKTLDIQQQIQLAFQMQANVIKTLNENNDLLKQINNDLTIKLDQNSEYYSIKRVSIINDKTQKSYNWRKLKDMSFKMQKEIKSVPDNNYGLVNSYHISVWKICYPDERY